MFYPGHWTVPQALAGHGSPSEMQKNGENSQEEYGQECSGSSDVRAAEQQAYAQAPKRNRPPGRYQRRCKAMGQKTSKR
jgi:hypothetical protein